MGYTFAVTVGPMLLWLTAGRILFKPMRPKASEEYLKVFTSFTALCFPVILALGYSRSHLFMNYSHRFFAPTLSVLLVPMMVEGDRILNKLQLKDAKSFIQNSMKVGLILLSLIQLSVFIIKLKLEFTWTSYYQRVMTQLYIPVADTLKAELPPNAKVALYMDAGMIAFRSNLTCIDFGKLNDPVLAHGKRDSAFVTDYFFGKMPDAAVFTSMQYDNYDYIPEAHQIQSDSRFENYQLFRKFKTDLNDPYFQFIYLKKAR
jgi:hypothetical protein